MMEPIKVKCDVPRELSIAAGQVKYGSLDIEITPELLVLASPETRRRLARGWSTETETGDRDYRLRIVQWTPGHDVPTAADLAASFEAALAAEAETTAKYERAIADHVGRMSDADLASLFDPSRGEGVRYLGTRLLATWETIRRVCPDVGARIERGRAQKAAEAEARKRAEARLHAERAERAAAEKAKAEEDFAAIAAALDAADPALARQWRAELAREKDVARALLAPAFDAIGLTASSIVADCDACEVEREDREELSRAAFAEYERVEARLRQLPKELHGAPLACERAVRAARRSCEYDSAHDTGWTAYAKVTLTWRGLSHYRTHLL